MQAIHQASWLQGFGCKLGRLPRSTGSMHKLAFFKHSCWLTAVAHPPYLSSNINSTHSRGATYRTADSLPSSPTHPTICAAPATRTARGAALPSSPQCCVLTHRCLPFPTLSLQHRQHARHGVQPGVSHCSGAGKGGGHVHCCAAGEKVSVLSWPLPLLLAGGAVCWGRRFRCAGGEGSQLTWPAFAVA